MSKTSPWDAIAAPKVDFTVIRVPGTTGVPIYWGRDSLSQSLFIVELTGDFSVQLRKDSIVLSGISVDIRAGEKPGQQRLVLALARHVDSDLFLGLCETLIESLRTVVDSATALAVAMTHLRRWKAFLAGKASRLGPEQVRGLFAELALLQELCTQLKPVQAVEAWKGPEKSHQDFIFGNTAIEVKSLSGQERSKVHISSEDQLESLNDNLFLRIYRLSDIPEAPASRSLNRIIEEIQGLLNTAEALEDFETKLIAHSYAPLPDYEEPLFVVSEVQSYRVEGDFPRLVRSEMPEGVGQVSYEIELESIEEYRCSPDIVFGGNDGTDI